MGDDAATREPIFNLREYAVEEQRFLHEAVKALARVRDPLLGRIPTEPSSRIQTTRITTDGGVTVEQPPIEIRSRLSQSADDLISGRLADLLVSLDRAADEYAGSFAGQFYDYLRRISTATGNVVDAKDRPFFESIYEMFEKVDLEFDDQGRIKQVLHINPADADAWEKGFSSMTPDQQRKLDELIERKRQESLARRRTRRIPRRSD